MPSSFEKINYNLRPNKCVERKMMAEALGRLSFLEHVENYRYIGFGSAYFADFVLFHKNLGIKDLISIEVEESKKLRFEFNIPYSGIKMHYGHSNKVLSNLELDLKKNIVWLDYDDPISDFMFSDIDSFFDSAMPGSFFILSVKVEEDFLPIASLEENPNKQLKEYRLNELINRVGKARIPNEYMDVQLSTKNLTAVTYEMLNRQIATSLLNRNGKHKNLIEYKQVFNFTYKDGISILTIGGIIFDSSQKVLVNKMNFESLPFTTDNHVSYKINSPNLTFREIKALDKALPDTLETSHGKFKNKKLQAIPLIANDIENYAKIYRYYPNFTEANL